MTLLRQIIQLLSESPGNIVYHLVTLFALQAIFAVSFTHWRRNPTHQFATRSMWAAGSIFVIRLLLLGTSLVLIEIPALTVVVLPLLEQALNTLTIMLMVWALVPHSNRLPHLGHLLLLLGILVSLAMTVSFVPTWRTLSADGIAYNSTGQATIWGLLQIAVLAAGFALAMLNARWRSTLSPVILLFMLLTHVAHFWNYPEIIPTDTNIIYWIRLGYLVALPLWAAMAYRQSIMPLLLAQRKKSGPTTELQSAILNAAKVIKTEDRDAALPASVTLIASVVDASFVAVGVLTEDAQPMLALTSNLPQGGTDQPRTWLLPVSDWTALEAVVSQRRWVELHPEGVGAGQLHRFYEELAIGPFGALFLQPLLDENQIVGLLLLAQAQGTTQVSRKDREVAPMLAEFVVSTLNHIERFMQRSALVIPPSVAAETAVSGRIIALEESGKKLQDQLNVAQDRLVQAENRAATAGKRAHDLAATLEEIERVNQDERVTALMQEIDTLRESLIEAEEAMALASAGEGGLSTEWVMLTITRYSGQLEEAQSRIEALEKQVALQEMKTVDPVIISLIQELRTPMTSIAGFTNLMLAETVGLLGVRQRDLLQRILANNERMGTLLDQIVQLTSMHEKSEGVVEEQVDVREVIETAVNGIITQVREKRLNLDLNIAEDLPRLAVNRQDLHQIVRNLLGNACQVAAEDGRIMVTANADVVSVGADRLQEQIHFVHLSVTDSGGGIPVNDRPRVFAPQHSADLPLITGLGDTGAGLSMAHALTEANGGRIWLDSEVGVGSTFSVLFPVGTADGKPQMPANGHLAE